MLPARVRRRSLEAISQVLWVLLLCKTTLRTIVRWVPMTSELGGPRLLRLAKATLLTLSLVSIEAARRKRCCCP
jgi:hypothetical protein